MTAKEVLVVLQAGFGEIFWTVKGWTPLLSECNHITVYDNLVTILYLSYEIHVYEILADIFPDEEAGA